jgi:hypothetical protein
VKRGLRREEEHQGIRGNKIDRRQERTGLLIGIVEEVGRYVSEAGRDIGEGVKRKFGSSGETHLYERPHSRVDDPAPKPTANSETWSHLQKVPPGIRDN